VPPLLIGSVVDKSVDRVDVGNGVKVPVALIGSRVERTAFDQQVRLSLCALDPDEGYRLGAELVVETPFLFRDAAGEWPELDPGTGVSLAPVLAL
jgi:hypothetical protein